MASLAIDTATEICAIALADGQGAIDEATINAGRSHLEMLLPGVYGLLSKNSLGITDIDRVAVGTGPGTFSGLRIGIATARALAQALKTPLFGASTLKALAQGMAEGRETGKALLLPVIDAKRGQVFAQAYTVQAGGDVNAASDILCLAPQELITVMPALGKGPVLAAGNGVLAYWPLFEAAPQVELIDRRDPRQLIHAAFHLAAIRQGALKPGSLFEVLPTYVREPDADKTVLLRKKAPWLK